jgi:hypothetical protein
MARMKFVGEDEPGDANRYARAFLMVVGGFFAILLIVSILTSEEDAVAAVPTFSSDTRVRQCEVLEKQARALESIDKTLKEINKRLR